MLRFSLASLLGLVLIAAIGSAALANGTEIWRQAMVTVSVTVLLVATLAALVRHGNTQAFSLGVAVCGWIYLVLAFVSVLGLRDDLLTDRAVSYLFTVIHEDTPRPNEVFSVAFSPDGETLASGSANGTARVWDLSTGQLIRRTSTTTLFSDFADIGHAVWAIIVGCTGGLVALVLRNARTESSSGPAAR